MDVIFCSFACKIQGFESTSVGTRKCNNFKSRPNPAHYVCAKTITEIGVNRLWLLVFTAINLKVHNEFCRTRIWPLFSHLQAKINQNWTDRIQVVCLLMRF